MATSSIPLSLQTNKDYLQNWMIPRGSAAGNIPGNGSNGASGPMIWVEVVDEDTTQFCQASANQPSAAHMTFATLWSNFSDYGSDIFLTILGGYDDSTNKMASPMLCPLGDEGLAGLFATDVSVKSTFVDNSVAWAAGSPSPYRLAVFTITFQSLPYDVDAPQGAYAYNPNWIEIKQQATNEAFQSPAGYYIFTGTTQTAINGTIYPYTSAYVEVIVHRVPQQTVLGAAGPAVSPLQQFIGTVNDATFLGAPIHTMLLDSVVCAPYGDWRGLNIYDVHLFFNYRENDWYKALADDGTWKAIITNSGGNPPIPHTTFNTIFTTLIPDNE